MIKMVCCTECSEEKIKVRCTECSEEIEPNYDVCILFGYVFCSDQCIKHYINDRIERISGAIVIEEEERLREFT